MSKDKNQDNPFKEMEKSVQQVPPELRKKVMSDIATAKLLMDFTGLFTLNLSEAVASLFKTKE